MRSKLVAVAATGATVLVLGACSGVSDAPGGGEGPTGDPVSGGTGRIIQTNEPRGLDPALIANSWANAPLVGNALYGQLLIDDPTTGEVQYRIAEDLTTEDGGSTFTLRLRDGVQFSDGTNLDAADVKATWEHAKDPATASVDFPQANTIDELVVVDPLTLQISLATAIPRFPNSILQTGLNWITSEESVAAGSDAMDRDPVGAGPYVLEEFARGDKITLVRNDDYYGEPAYLDRIEVRAMTDPEQRYNTVSTGGADLAVETQWLNIDKAEQAGLQTAVLEFGGGSIITMDNTKPPFDDVRARQALATGISLDSVNDAVNQGTGEVPTTLFGESSPFYDDIPLVEHDPDRAQDLLDELAADGTPLSFTLSVFPGPGVTLGSSIQTQMSAYDNVEVEVRTIDIAEYGSIMSGRDYDAITNSITFGVEPEPRLWAALSGASSGNFSGVDDEELNAALDLGRTSLDQTEREQAYVAAQERFVELAPVIFYLSSAPSVIANGNVGGIQQYGLGSVLPETLWLAP